MRRHGLLVSLVVGRAIAAGLTVGLALAVVELIQTWAGVSSAGSPGHSEAWSRKPPQKGDRRDSNPRPPGPQAYCQSLYSRDP